MRSCSSIVLEAIIDDERPRNAFGSLMGLNVPIETRGGFAYPGADCAAGMREAGFRQTRVEPPSGPDSTVIGVKQEVVAPRSETSIDASWS